ncbi:MAG: ATP-binding protein [Betaproteobacteria bacterium]
MNYLQEVARLNLVLELVSECAGLESADAVAEALRSRLHWILDFEQCTLVLRRAGQDRWFTLADRDERLGPSTGQGSDCAALARQALATGAPACSLLPMDAVAYPLGHADSPLGALCLMRHAMAYTYRDLRLIHHVSASLGAVLTRITHQEEVEAQRREVRDLALLAERDRTARAEAATYANDAFLAMLGHELRNPLAPILAATELLRLKARGEAAPEVDIIERQARHLDRLVSDLLDVSRVTTGKISLRLSTLDLGQVLIKAVEMARPLMDRKGQVLSVSLPHEPLLVDGDETRLSRVVSNLLDNASIYSPAGGTVKQRCERVGHEVAISVSDDGIGIAPELIDRIFEMFVQGGRSKEIAPAGLGLGLGVARSLVEMHGGRIRATSAGEGHGSLFTVVLPALGAADAPLPVFRAPVSVATSGASRRVLLVDDNQDAADLMAELARAAGHIVEVAYDPRQALAIALEFRPEVAVLDIGLPGMDGYQLALALRERPGAASLTLIALSGYGQERDRERSRAQGFAGHLVKPANVSELLALIADSSSKTPA